MCGIVGIVGGHPAARAPLVREMADAIVHRGPDSDGYHATRLADVGVRRLAIVDLEHGDQPILSETGDRAIVFNGEIYNYRELRAELVQRGHRFRSDADTEVILHLFEDEGADCLRRLHGMFAFAIVSDDEVFIARDRLGIKPLYVTSIRGGGTLLFASEVKALLRCREVDVSVDPASFADRRVLGYQTGLQTAFAAIRRLPPGHYLRLRDRAGALEVEERRYYQVSVAPQDRGFDEAAGEVRDALQQAVDTHVHADVPVSLTLSGGIDSTLLAWMLRSGARGATRTYTIACDPQAQDRLAGRTLAGALELRHEETLPTFEEYVDVIPRFVWAAETVPSTASIPLHLLCRRIGRSVKVCLNGEGADELFAGYPEYLDPARTVGALGRELARAEALGLPVSERAREIVAALRRPRRYAAYLGTLLELFQQDQLELRHLAVLDHHAMASSLEIRVPFLDDRVVETANTLPLSFKARPQLGVTKYILKRLLLRLAGDAGHDAALRRKDGFPSPGEPWRSRFAALCQQAISDDYAAGHRYRDFFCRRTPEGGLAGKERLLLFDVFEQIFVRDRGTLGVWPSMMAFMAERASRQGRNLLSGGAARAARL